VKARRRMGSAAGQFDANLLLFDYWQEKVNSAPPAVKPASLVEIVRTVPAFTGPDAVAVHASPADEEVVQVVPVTWELIAQVVEVVEGVTVYTPQLAVALTQDHTFKLGVQAVGAITVSIACSGPAMVVPVSTPETGLKNCWTAPVLCPDKINGTPVGAAPVPRLPAGPVAPVAPLLPFKPGVP
jgi:hypothetical protein